MQESNSTKEDRIRSSPLIYKLNQTEINSIGELDKLEPVIPTLFIIKTIILDIRLDPPFSARYVKSEPFALTMVLGSNRMRPDGNKLDAYLFEIMGRKVDALKRRPRPSILQVLIGVSCMFGKRLFLSVC